ncbi:MAG: triphosphoribosyl-dephospho-CoA synthase [Oribacterium sp.]|nr:triphosphoribosyl-dephospho-CoA synthase [Oribacterium sp.]
MEGMIGREFHSAEELVEIVGWNVRNALLGEVYATPKPGLVDRRDTGAHKDMTYETFLASTEAITPYLALMFRQGLLHQGVEELLFLNIRKTGIEAEKAMYAATGNVNTHKGMIFTMGILLAAAGLNAKEKSFDISEILETGRRMSARILEKDFEEMEKREPKSHGEKLYRKYGERGIRGQAIEGFPIIRDIGIPAMRKFMSISENMKLRSEIAETATLRTDLLEGEGSMRDEHYENAVNISTLIAIMSELRDTNVLTRSSYEEMEWLRAESAKILRLGAVFSEEGLSAIEELNVKCIEKNISPGGAADILAVTILLLKLEGINYV